MSIPPDRRYSESHEWYAVDGNTVTMGISQFAADELTDITFVELPDAGKEIQAGASIGEIESVKATSELISAVAGKIVAVNGQLTDRPELINEDAFDAGWIVKLQAADLAPLEALMDATAYERAIAT